MQAHFVTYYSPGTFVPEETTRKIASWNVDDAVKGAFEIVERYGSRPFGFQFTTRGRSEADLDSKETDRSPMYYLGGVVRTADEVLAGTAPDEYILRANVEGSSIKRVLVNTNSWKFTTELKDDDVVLDVKLPAPAK